MKNESTIVRGELKRQPEGIVWAPPLDLKHLGAKGGVGWQSNGGASRHHPSRALPFTLEVQIPPDFGRLKQVYLIGLLALSADPLTEPSGALGGLVTLSRAKKSIHRLDLIQGRHYGDAREVLALYRPNGDGSCLETLGSVDIEGVPHRVDMLSFSIPPQAPPDCLTFTDLGTPASFVFFDILFEFDQAAVCPFRGHGGKVGLHELSAILRLKDWPRYERALTQLEQAVRHESEDMDEAKGLALTFLAAVSSALLEAGSDRRMHQFLLHAARTLDQMDTASEIADHAVALCGQLAQGLFGDQAAHAEALIHRALAYLDRHYAEDVSDADMASRVRLSTSHFRHLFRQVTKQPFHKYLLSLRLEKAREMILQTDQAISDVSERCGFASAAHFSRAFAHRFGASPSSLRQSHSS